MSLPALLHRDAMQFSIPPGKNFNRITRLASSVFQAPIAAISLIDENRLWFKSRINIDICEADRDMSFCSHAILL
jgi:hypothetical protein